MNKKNTPGLVFIYFILLKMKRLFSLSAMTLCCALAMAQGTPAQSSESVQPAAAANPTVTWDRHSLMFDGRRVCPVMGEVHYSRIPADEWEREVRKMKEGGLTLIATYVFWNHIEEREGRFRWDGQRDLRRFLEVCKQEHMPVVLRLGPFCHGEVRNGGIPDWMFTKGCRLRSQDKTFLSYVERLYRQIFTQVQGLQWKDGGPVIAAQFDNEYRGSGDYLMALKNIAHQIGFDLPFYTRTGWPALSKPVPFGEMLPLYGDYADGFWDKEVKEGVGNYYKAFNFKGFRSSTAIGTDLLGKQEAKTDKGDDDYPYFTCELGGGMVTAYHRRPFISPDDCYSLAVVKLGSGSNLLGYYMYHGGTNPEGELNTLNEVQTSPGTANNDLPVCTYDLHAGLWRAPGTHGGGVPSSPGPPAGAGHAAEVECQGKRRCCLHLRQQLRALRQPLAEEERAARCLWRGAPTHHHPGWRHGHLPCQRGRHQVRHRTTCGATRRQDVPHAGGGHTCHHRHERWKNAAQPETAGNGIADLQEYLPAHTARGGKPLPP